MDIFAQKAVLTAVFIIAILVALLIIFSAIDTALSLKNRKNNMMKNITLYFCLFSTGYAIALGLYGIFKLFGVI